MKIGVDLGGSHIGVGLIEGINIVDSEDKILTRSDRAEIEKSVTNEITRMINVLCDRNNINIKDLELIGIASPGTISNGVIILVVETLDIIFWISSFSYNRVKINK